MKVAEGVHVLLFFFLLCTESVWGKECVWEGKKCQKHAIFRPAWHGAKTQANCCFSHITLSLFTICPPSLSQCVFVYRSLFLCRPSQNCCFLPAWLIRSWLQHSPPPPSSSLLSIKSAWRSPQDTRHIFKKKKRNPDSHHSFLNVVSGLKMAPIWIFSPQRWCNIRSERQWLSGNMCQRAGGHRRKKRRKKQEESFSWSTGIFSQDDQKAKHKPPWLTNSGETHTYAETQIHSFPHKSGPSISSQTDRFRLSSHSCFSLPVFVRPAARCAARMGEKCERGTDRCVWWFGEAGVGSQPYHWS